MGGPRSFFNDPFNQRQYDSGGLNEQIAKVSTARRNEIKSLLEVSFKDGGLSKQTYNEMTKNLLNPTGTFDQYNEWEKDIKGEVAGTSNKGKARLATEKLFELAIDQPGRKQTLLTPRSNASKAILGV